MVEGKDKFDNDIKQTKEKGNDLATAISKGLGAVGKFGAKAVGVAVKASAAAIGAAATAVGAMTKASVESFAEYEQLAGGVGKIFEAMDTSRILQDASQAYKDLGMTANEYLSIINDVGASFASTMGAEAGYEAAKKGLTAISDYASGTGKNFSELQQKLALITRSTSSYQSIADQFSGVLPATSEGFLKQAQAVGVLDKKYRKLTDVPIQEYQKAVTEMLAVGVDALGLTGNTAAEATETISGSLTMLKASWKNLLTGLADDNADINTLIDNMASSAVTAAKKVAPRVTQILNGISTMVTKLSPMITNAIPVIISDILPGMLSAGVQLIQSLLQGISQNVGSLATSATDIIMMFVAVLNDNLPMLTEVAVQVVQTLLTGILQNADVVASSAIAIIMMLVTVFIENLPLMVEVAIQLVTALITGLSQKAPEIASTLTQGIGLAIGALLLSLPQFLDAGLQLIGGLCDGVMNGFTALFPNVGSWVEQYIYMPIRNTIGWFYNVGKEFLSLLWEGICDCANLVMPGLGDILSGGADKAVSAAATSMEGMTDAAASAALSATTAAADVVMSSGELIPVDAETPVSAMADIMENDTSMETAGAEVVQRTGSSMQTAVNSAGFDAAGTTAMQRFIDGINSMSGAVMSAVDAIASAAASRLQSALDSIQSTANSYKPGGYAKGLDYVPYDEFPALLHKGEAVLTAAEASVWRAGKKSGEGTVPEPQQQTSSQSGITIVQNIQAVPQTPVEFAAATEAYFEQARWAMA